jgi:hypothetical protein
MTAGTSAGFVYGTAIIFLLFRAWRGWRLGPVRQGLGLLALGVGVGAAFLGRGMIVPFLRPLGFPDRLLALLGGCVVGVFVYFVLILSSAILFKKTTDQSVALVRWGYGLFGAALGVGLGCGFLVLAVTGVRLSGKLIEATSRGSVSREKVARDWAWTQLAVDARVFLEQGPAGPLLVRLDPVPNSFYGIVEKVGRVAAQPDGLQRFLSGPELRAVAKDPRVLAIQRDSGVLKALQDGDLLTLLRDPKVVAFANDAEMEAHISEIDFQKALDYALAKPEKGASRASRHQP